MRRFQRYLRIEFRSLWRIWIPLLFLTATGPLFVIASLLLEKEFIDEALVARDRDRLITILVLFAIVFITSTASVVGQSLLRSMLIERLSLRLRRDVFRQSQRLSIAFSRREHSGNTVALFSNDVPNVATLYSLTTIESLRYVVGITAGIIAMISLSWQLALIAGILPLIVTSLVLRVTRPLRPAARQAQEKSAEITQRLQENLSGLREVSAFGQSNAQEQRFTTTLGELQRLRMRLARIDAALTTGQQLFTIVVTMIMFGFGGLLVINGSMTIGSVVAMRSLFRTVFQPIQQFGGIATSVQKALASADRVYDYLQREPQIQESETASTPKHVAGEVTFDHVHFGYTTDTDVLHDVSFTAHPGQVVALVGPSGAGKTTITSLLARFYDPTEGRVLLDGTDLREVSLAGLRDHIGVVFQDTFLFADTVRQNIALGRENASNNEIVAAAIAANAWEFIDTFPNGLDTMVGERGAFLSEGQKQRIAIARALLRDPKILILDEPTSALDARSEHLLQAALDNLMQGRTTFVIAHRLATVRRADCILVLDGGRIVEQGTHDELLARNGLYRELFDLQFNADDTAEVHDLPASQRASQDHMLTQEPSCVVVQEMVTDEYPGQIMILRNGTVVDAGTHDELLARNGAYRELVERHLGSAGGVSVVRQEPEPSPVALVGH